MTAPVPSAAPATPSSSSGAASGQNLPALLAMCQVSYRLGQLAEVVQWKGDRMEPGEERREAEGDHNTEPALRAPIPPVFSDKERALLEKRTTAFYTAYRGLAAACGVDVFAAWTAKMVKVRRKYPAELCRGRADKYTAYVEKIAAKEDVLEARERDENAVETAGEPEVKRRRTEEASSGQALGAASSPETSCSTRDADGSEVAAPTRDDVLSSRAQLREVVAARDWAQFHTPRNLLLALTGEVGEVAEEVQKISTVISPAERHAIGEELADCWSYLVRFCDAAGLPLEEFVGAAA